MSKLKEHAAKKRWESQHKKGHGDPMDIGAVNENNWDSYGYLCEPCEYDYSGESGDINAIKGGKSKGYGKGIGKSYGPPVCNNCWQTGHVKSECTNPPMCNICHQSGHMAFECPHSTKGVKGNNVKGTGKGMGKSFQNQYPPSKGWSPKGWGKGSKGKGGFKGKGVYEVSEQDPYEWATADTENACDSTCLGKEIGQITLPSARISATVKKEINRNQMESFPKPRDSVPIWELVQRGKPKKVRLQRELNLVVQD
jgi:hypothetical protein